MQNENNEINRCCNCGDKLMTRQKKNYFGKNRRFHDVCKGVRLPKHSLTIDYFNFVHKGNEKIPNDDIMREEAYSKYLKGLEYGRKKNMGKYNQKYF